MDIEKVTVLATAYTAAWCSQNSSSVASFFEEKGSLKINDAVASVGRPAIAAAAQGFMTAFPDLVVQMDGISPKDEGFIYRWTLTGTHGGPGGSGRSRRCCGRKSAAGCRPAGCKARRCG